MGVWCFAHNKSPQQLCPLQLSFNAEDCLRSYALRAILNKDWGSRGGGGIEWLVHYPHSSSFCCSAVAVDVESTVAGAVDEEGEASMSQALFSLMQAIEATNKMQRAAAGEGDQGTPCNQPVFATISAFTHKGWRRLCCG